MKCPQCHHELDPFEYLCFPLPHPVAIQFNAQIQRINQLLHRDAHASPVPAMEFIANFLDQTPEEMFGL